MRQGGEGISDSCILCVLFFLLCLHSSLLITDLRKFTQISPSVSLFSFLSFLKVSSIWKFLPFPQLSIFFPSVVSNHCFSTLAHFEYCSLMLLKLVFLVFRNLWCHQQVLTQFQRYYNVKQISQQGLSVRHILLLS